jgi:hypothetical protein
MIAMKMKFHRKVAKFAKGREGRKETPQFLHLKKSVNPFNPWLKILITGLATFAPLTAEETQNPVIVTKPLNPQEVIIVPTAYNITTTLEFPEAIQGIDGVGLTSQPENAKDNAVLFAVSHAPGSNFLSLTALQSTARTNVNVIYRGRAYVFVVVCDSDRALFKMSLTDPLQEAELLAKAQEQERRARAQMKPIPEQRESLRVSPIRLIGLMDKVKAYELLAVNDPTTLADLKHSKGPFEPSETKDYRIQPLSVTRKGQWDALVFEVAITNLTTKPLYHDPESFLVGVGPKSFRSITGDAGGFVEQGQTTIAYFVIQGDGSEGSNDLDPNNSWLITMQPVERGASDTLLPPVYSSKDANVIIERGVK